MSIWATWAATRTVGSLRVLGLNALGDAFLVETQGASALIDAGTRKGEVADRLQRGGIQHLDVVVCTHCDTDHIGGIPAVLRTLDVDEVWMPGSWLWVLESAAMATDEELDDLLRATASSFGVETRGPSQVDDWADAVIEEYSGQLEELRSAWQSTERPIDHQVAETELAMYGLARLSERDDRDMERRVRERLRSLRDIHQTATAHGTQVRYFSYERAAATPDAFWMKSGYPGWLTIVNALEVFPQSTLRAPVLLYVALSIQNRRAIVPFFEPLYPPSGSPGTGVLLSSDSSFEFTKWCPLPWARLGIMTAPHHGSDNHAHDAAYEEAEKHGFAGWWVRSHNDRSFPSWPSAKWKQLDVDRRYCTRCRGDKNRPAQDLWFVSSGLTWDHPDRLRPCHCGDH